MPGQAAGKSRGVVIAAMNKADCTPQKKHASGDSPVHHENLANRPIKSDGNIFGKTKKINIQGYC